MIRQTKPGILLDRDGTIIVDYHYVGHIERVQFIPGAIDAIRRFNEAGIPVAIITNQGGVARGFYDIAHVDSTHNYIAAELARYGVHIDLFLFSPHHPDGNIPPYNRQSYDHKPNPGMALRAAELLDLDLTQSYVVGDRLTDMKLAWNIGAIGIYLGPKPIGPGTQEHTFAFHSLAEAATFIIEGITGMAISNSVFPTMRYSGILSYFIHYSDEITNALSLVNKEDLAQACDILYTAYSDGSAVWVAGNGGAAAIADHMATDHAKHMAATDTLSRNIHSLAANHVITTALANDIGNDGVFAWQLEQFGQKNDVLVVFSVSGESRNIIRALQCAQEMGMMSIAITGGEAYSIGNNNLATVQVKIPATNYGIVEDTMQIIQHSLAQYIRQTQMTDAQIQSARF